MAKPTFALVGILTMLIGFLAVAVGFLPDGSDIQMILGALFLLISVVSFLGVAIVGRMDKQHTKDSTQ
jgi:flagellar motor component MotA